MIRDHKNLEDIDVGDEQVAWTFKEGIALPEITKLGRGLVPRGFSFL